MARHIKQFKSWSDLASFVQEQGSNIFHIHKVEWTNKRSPILWFLAATAVPGLHDFSK